MIRFHSSIPLLLAGVLLAGLWHAAPPFAEPDGAGQALPPEASAAAGLAVSALSPFAVGGKQAVTSNVPATAAQQARQQFEQSLHDYRHGALSPEQKIRIKQSLHEFKRDPAARALLVNTFFSSTEPQLAQTLAKLMLDADIKDVSLVEQLIAHDSRTGAMAATAATTANKARILALIADLGNNDQARYSGVIDGYLAQTANSADPQLSATAASQRIWYLNQHQPYNLVVQEKYLVDSNPVLRAEVVSLVEARLASQTLSDRAQWVAALNAALKADYPGAFAGEKARISALLGALAGGELAL